MHATRLNSFQPSSEHPASDLTSLRIKTLAAAGISPITLSEKIDWNGPSFLLHGSEGGWFDGRFSLLGGAPFGIFQSKGTHSRFENFTSQTAPETHYAGDPLVTLQTLLDRFQTRDAKTDSLKIPFASGGVLGFFSYELLHQFENIPETKADSALPDIYLLFLNCYLIFDHKKDLIHLIYNLAPEIQSGTTREAARQNAHARISAIEKMITSSESPPHPQTQIKKPDTSKIIIKADTAKEHYMEIVKRAKTNIAAGDIFQANLSQRFSGTSNKNTLFEIYRRLWQINPSPFSCFLDFGEIQIASASPERLVRITKGTGGDLVETRPIAGTRPRGKTSDQDADLVNALYQSEKERAEHLMLVDLERNDLGKVCEYGSVEVDALMQLEKYSHVSHLVSNIKGTLRKNTSPLSVLKALFPGGTITGVPKIRCMEIISALEEKPRGIYTGSIGYIGFDGETDLNIAIRTWVKHKQEISFQVGAGIVADSDPEKEYEETLQKAAALMKALHPFE